MINFFEDLFSEKEGVGPEVVSDGNVVVLPEISLTEEEVKKTLAKIKAILIEKYYVQIEQLETLAANHVIKDDETEVQGVDMVSQLKEIKSNLDNKRKEIINIPGSYVNGINAIVKPFRDKIDAVTRLKEKDLLEYQKKARKERMEQERKAAEVIAKIKKDAEEEAKKAGLKPGVIDIQAPSLSEERVSKGQTGGTATIKQEYVYRLVDIRLVPEELIEIKDKEVKKLIRAGTRNISGLEIYLEEKLKTRKARNKS